jgi:hypothetical protein
MSGLQGRFCGKEVKIMNVKEHIRSIARDVRESLLGLDSNREHIEEFPSHLDECLKTDSLQIIAVTRGAMPHWGNSGSNFRIIGEETVCIGCKGVERRSMEEIRFENQLNQKERLHRRRSLANIATQLNVDQAIMPFHEKDDVNLTTLLIWEDREDLAKQLWLGPKIFREKHAELVDLGVNRVMEIFLKSGGAVSHPHVEEWKNALSAIPKEGK